MSGTGPFRVFYDEQCEICQAGVTWLKILDRHGLIQVVAMDSELLATVDSRLDPDACSRELHILGPHGELWVGGAAVRRLARLFPITWIAGALFEIPILRQLSDVFYRYVARHRYQISKCRGGNCRTLLTARPRESAGLSAFWTCYSVGFLLRLPIAMFSAFGQLWRNSATYFRTRRRRLSFFEGKLQVYFLGSAISDVVPPLFGEQFWMVAYDGVLVDPGGRECGAPWLVIYRRFLEIRYARSWPRMRTKSILEICPWLRDRQARRSSPGRNASL